jgi:hypothetical protein
MYSNPKENRTQVDRILLEEFRRKGYKCEEILQDDATVFIIKHGKKHSDFITQVVNDSYKDLLRTN